MNKLPKKEKKAEKTVKIEDKMVKMECIAPGPQFVPGVGKVAVGGTFLVPPEKAKELEKGLFKRA